MLTDDDAQAAYDAAQALLHAETRVELLRAYFLAILAGVDAVGIGRQTSETSYTLMPVSVDYLFFARWEELTGDTSPEEEKAA